MWKKIKELYEKHQGLFWYLVIGGITTVIDIIAFWFAHDIVGVHYQIAKIFAWILAVAFAFFGNRMFVFRSEAKGAQAILAEAGRFVAMRVLTLLFSLGFMYVAVDLFGLDENLSNILSLIFVLILNYVLSKLVVFRKKKEGPDA